jgi:hypothetical protein
MNSVPEPNYRAAQNGRVTYVTRSTAADQLSTAPSERQAQSFVSEALTGIQERTPLSNFYFSPYNFKWIQDQIRYEVYRQSNRKYVIPEQNTTELGIVMRSIYLQYSMNLPTLMKEQILYLNNEVIQYSVPRILAEIDNYYGYLNNIQQQAVPIMLPENVSSKGSKTLRSVTSTF